MHIHKTGWIIVSIFIVASACRLTLPQSDSLIDITAPSPVPIESPAYSAVQPIQTDTASPVDRNFCGDDVCSGPENIRNCPRDCPHTGITKPQTFQETAESVTSIPAAGEDSGDGVLFIGIMVHLEGWEDDVNQQRFALHAKAVREYADLFEKYGGKLTFESKEMTEGVHRWGDNVLLEMEQRGHGVGVHADLGGEKGYDCSQFAADLAQLRQRLEALGVTTRHVSGNSSTCDWVTASIDAGYKFTTGQVAYSVMSMPVNERPPEFRNCPNPGACHDVFPRDLADRIHPWRANSGYDWVTHDPDGQLVILSSSSGIKTMYEESRGLPIDKNKVFSNEDIDEYFRQLEEALSLSSLDQVNIFYVSWSMGSELDRSVTEEWLKRLLPYIESGRVQWKTLPEMYDAYIAWEQ
jgi:hypothetical protein